MNTEHAHFPDKETLRIERILPASQKMVWACLTEAEHKSKWLSGGEVEPEVGGKVTHHFDHKTLSDEVEEIPDKYKNSAAASSLYGKVLIWNPYSQLSYTWFEEEASNSIVTFELFELSENQTRLLVTHSRIPDSRDFKLGVSAGWHTHLDILVDVLSGNPPKGFWRAHMALEKFYANRI